VVVVSHRIFNEAPAWRSVIVVPCSTSDAQRRRAATVVSIPRRAGGLPTSSVAICHQVTTLDRAKLIERIGTLSNEHLRAIGRGLVIALQLDELAML
jgi:mRNA-degrading endonuclease toxin of MazEF toxin-antitoxin module